MNEKMNVLEKKLLDRELKRISDELEKIGQQLINVFKPYGTIQGEVGDELKAYIASDIISSNEIYYGGYTTQPAIDTNAHKLPQAILDAILEHVVTDFLDRAEEIAEMVYDLDRGVRR